MLDKLIYLGVADHGLVKI